MPKTRILVVDDSVVVRRLLTNVLSDEPTIDVVGAAPNGRIAIAKITQVNPDLIILDVEMPEMDGLEATQAIRALGGRFHKLPIVALTAAAMPKDRERCLAAGMDDYITKPLQFDELIRILEETYEDLGRPTGQTVGSRRIGSPEFDLITDGDPEQEKRFLFDFAESLNSVKATLADLTPQKLGEIASKMHAIRPQAVLFGSPPLGNIAFELERLAEANDFASLQAAAPRFVEEADAFAQCIHDYCQSLADEAKNGSL